ncbi:hypothetical protein ACN5XJ_26570 (plasmid) [Priestia sp. MF3]|uniref:hypothetical protein n=1 Tax=Priestia sp. MF3 TaxID=3404779 RepID=UPI003BA21F27
MEKMVLSVHEKEFFREILLNWGKRNYVCFPWRNTSNKWHALAVEVMLQRTKAEQVLPVYELFTKKYATPDLYLQDKNSNIFMTLGLPEREKNLKKLAEIVANNTIPLEKKELLKLPGVGNYIAAAFRSLHMNIKDTIIDSNVVRLYGRFWGFETNAETRRKKWFIKLAESLIPIHRHKDYNYSLLDFTRAVCKPHPDCVNCPLKVKCNYYTKERQ